MNVKISGYFQKQLSKLAKTFQSVKQDCEERVWEFDLDNEIHLGERFFKLRCKNSDIPCGKSGGYRIIVFYEFQKNVIVPLIIYSKRDKENVSKEDIKQAAIAVFKELN